MVAEYKKFCESCGGKVAFPQEYLGKQVNCPHCQALTLLNDPAAAAAPQQVPATSPRNKSPQLRPPFQPLKYQPPLPQPQPLLRQLLSLQ